MQILGHASRTDIENSEAVKPIPQHTKLSKLTVMPDDYIDDVFTLMYYCTLSI